MTIKTELMNGKTILIMGVANERSIAWSTLLSLRQHGVSNFILTFKNDKAKERLIRITKGMDKITFVKCDVTSDQDIEDLYNYIKSHYGKIDGIVHSIAYANNENMKGQYFNVSRTDFSLAQDISSYSLVAVVKYLHPVINSGGSIVTMTYIGSERIIKNYNIMGVAKASLEASMRYLANDLGSFNIRINALSSGPIRTLSSKGISGFSEFKGVVEKNSLIENSINQSEVGDTTMFLLSNLSRGITGQTIYVDHGFSVVGIK